MSEQSLQALQRAQDIRLGRAMIKKEIRDGKVSVVDVLETEPYVCDTMSVLQLFMAQRGWALRKADRFILRTLANPGKKLGQLNKRERTRLVERYKEQYGNSIPQ
jgi:hypothetical protein